MFQKSKRNTTMASYSDMRLHDAFAAVKGEDLCEQPLQIRAIPKNISGEALSG